MLFVVSGCASTPPAPAGWVVGSEWEFVVANKDGSTQTFVFRVTDRPAGRSEEWFELDAIVDPRPGWMAIERSADGTERHVPSRFQSVSSFDGRRLEVNLAGRMKDVGDRLVGEIHGDRFEGRRRRSSMLDDEWTAGRVEGRRLR